VHELPIAQSLLDGVLAHAAQSRAVRVTDVHLIVGDLSGVSPECVAFYWDTIRCGTVAHDATLHVRRVPFELMCLECSKAFTPQDQALEYSCPECGSDRTRISHGQECCLEAIDIVPPDDEGQGACSPMPEARA